ncbi:MAG: hypothetical protein KAS32_12510 [Candidatus Peribacteraceae bacterium]|nr:hypothetical protein [Candidatus Peribacteraceae bacterium]
MNTLLNQYFREKKFYCYYELKQTQTESFQFSKIRKVQGEGLPATEKNGFVWKLSDEISRPKPMDGFSAPPLPSYLIIKFKHEFVFIRYSEITKLREKGIISISRKTAEKISEKIIKI